VAALEPSALYPVRHQRWVWYLLVAAIVLIVILPYGVPYGILPLSPGRAEVGPLPTDPSGAGATSGNAEERTDEGEADGEVADLEPPREVAVELYPELPSYGTAGPVPITVRTRTRDADPRTVEGRLMVRLDGGPWAPLPGTVRIEGGREHDRMRSFDLRQALGSVTEVGPGTHRVQAALERTDGAEAALSEEVEIFVEPGDDGGGGGGGGEEERPDEPEPEPEPPASPPGGDSPETPPPDVPESPPPTMLVRPLFDEGETVRKVGPALLFDPEAPRGDPPRARPLSETFPELRRRAEDAVSRDEVPPEWRDLVLRYFDLIRPR
jgi:hypothetical protein